MRSNSNSNSNKAYFNKTPINSIDITKNCNFFKKKN